MADEPQKVVVQANRVDATILPAGFSMAYRLYVIQQGSDLKNLADSSNNANDLAYQATIKNQEQDLTLSDHEGRIVALRIEVDNHEVRIVGNTNAIGLLSVRLDTAEGKISLLQNDVTYLLNEVVTIESDMVSKSSASNQNIQSGGGVFIVGSVATPTTDKLQVAGSSNVSVSYKVSGLQVVGARRTGWTASTGSAYRGAFDANKLQPVSATYSQAEVNAIMGILLEARQRIKALEDDIRAHGQIN